MHAARNSLTDAVVYASAFALLDEATRAEQTPMLVCGKCNRSAYFIRRSAAGRAACFGSRPHVKGCDGKAPESEDGGKGGFADGDIRTNLGHEFIVTFAPLTPIVHLEEDGDAAPRPNGAQRHVNDRGLIRSASSIFITKLLEKLVGDPAYAASDDQLRIDGLKTTVSEHCVNALDIDHEHHGVIRLYWGIVTAVKAAEDVTWLNLGPFGTPSVALGPQDSRQILDSFGFEHARMLRGSSFAFHGRAERVKDDRMMLRPQNVERFAMLLPSVHPAARN